MPIKKGVMWDCFNVLIHFDTPNFFDFVREYRGNSLPPESLFTDAGLLLQKNYDLSLLSNEDFYEGVVDLFKMRGVSKRLFFRKLGSILRPDREMLAIRDEFQRRGIIMVLVSNMNPFHLNYVRNNYPEFLAGNDCTMVSCECGIAKPDPEIFIKPLDFLGLRAEEFIFIDDTLANVDAAWKVGIWGWHYNVTDKNYCNNGRTQDERNKFKHFLDFLWNNGVFKSKL